MEKSRLSSQDLVKIYKKRAVVNKSSIEVSQGEIVGLLGPNGAGKTTTFYMMVGMISPTALILLPYQCTNGRAWALVTCRRRRPSLENFPLKIMFWRFFKCRNCRTRNGKKN